MLKILLNNYLFEPWIAFVSTCKDSAKTPIQKTVAEQVSNLKVALQYMLNTYSKKCRKSFGKKLCWELNN